MKNENNQINLTASRVGSYFNNECLRNLVYESAGKKLRKELDWPEPDGSNSASALAGNEWEQYLLSKLIMQSAKNESCVLYKANDGKFDVNETIDILKHLSDLKAISSIEGLDDSIELSGRYKCIYIYQSSVRATESFSNEIGLSSYANIGFSKEMYPDFLMAEYDEINDSYVITVIDVKGASHIKTNAQIQIALYAKMLDGIVKENNISKCVINLHEGKVWNRDAITKTLLENEFTLKEANSELLKFFKKDGPADKANYALERYTDGNNLLELLPCTVSSGCAYCDNFDKCHSLLLSKRSARLIPYISRLAQERLNEKVEDGLLEDESVESVYKILSSENHNILTDGCGSWKKVRNDLEQYINAYKAFVNGKNELEKLLYNPYPKKGASISFPSGQDYALILSAQKDESSGRIYAYSWYLNPGKKLDLFSESGLSEDDYAKITTTKTNPIGLGSYYDGLVAKNNSDEEFRRIDIEFVNHIYDILSRINASKLKVNTKAGIRFCKAFQIFVMDKYEKENIENALFNIISYLDLENQEDYSIMKKVVTILFWIQGERNVTDMKQQTTNTVDNPICIISLEVKNLYVLPKTIMYDLKGISEVFLPNYNFANSRDSFFTKMSNIVNGLKIREAWESDEEKAEELFEKLRWHMIRRMDIEKSIVIAIQKRYYEGEIVLPNRAENYAMDESIANYNPEQAKLLFECKYEQLLAYKEVLQVRAKGIDNAILDGDILSVEYLGGNSFKILNKDSYIGESWFSFWICKDTEENRERIYLIKDNKYKDDWRLNILSFDGEKVFATSDMNYEMDYDDDGENAYLTAYVRDFSQNPSIGENDLLMKKGDKYLIFERYTDYNTPKIIQGLNLLNDKYSDLLYPERSCKDMPVSFDEAKNICSKYWSMDGFAFSPSQEAAFKHLMERKLTVLVGPPAAGKTDFISRSIITIMRYYEERKGQKLKVMVSAMSHPAIDNILMKLSKMLKKEAGKHSYTKINLYKHKRFAGNELEDVELTTGNYGIINKLASDEMLVMGMNCFDAAKGNVITNSNKFDLIVIDEASQLRFMDSLLLLESANKDARILLVGDNNQLPPIIAGKYKREEDKKYIFGSVFDMYISALSEVNKTEDIVNLYENFRMNNILCRYSAKKIYGDKYKAFNKEIANQQIKLKNVSNDEMLDFILDPDYPAVFIKLTGPSKNQKQAEITIVTKLVEYLYNNLQNSDGSLAKDSGNFWDEKNGFDGGLGIISPHHEHINRLKTNIVSKLHFDKKDVYIDTVEKLQGKERLAIIVSYGVSDREIIEKESEFIFSRNRFNVSLTRGKAKTIVFLSDVVAESTIISNNLKATSKELSDGIEYVQGLEAFMQSKECDEAIMQKDYIYSDAKLTIMKKRVI